MASICPPLPMNIDVRFEPRPDGGLRAYCDEVPGFVLSNRNPDVVIGAVEDVLQVILSEMMDCNVIVQRTVSVADARQHHLPAFLTDKPASYVGIPTEV